MKNWFLGIMLTLLFAGSAHAASQLKLPGIFTGMTITPDMVQTTPGKDGAMLVSIKIAVPPDAPSTASPMDGYREDMWRSGQLRVDKHLAGAPAGLTAEQSYKTMFCLVNRADLGFECKNTAEIMSAPRTKPWLIPIVVIPQAEVGRLTAMLTSGPIPASITGMAANQQQVADQPDAGALLPWSDSGVHAPPEMEWYEGPVPGHLRRSAYNPPVKNSGPGGPPSKKRTR